MSKEWKIALFVVFGLPITLCLTPIVLYVLFFVGKGFLKGMLGL